MRLPAISNEAEARALVETVATDERIGRLLDIFSPANDLSRLVEFLDSSIGQLQWHERAHATAIADAWRARLTAPPVTAAAGLPGLAERAKVWDFRLGQERDAIPVSADILPPDVVTVVNSMAADWGMFGQDPVSGTFDVVVAIGGLVRANIARPATAAALLADEVIGADYVVGLGGQRDTSPAERELAQAMGVPADSEPAALRYGLEQAFGLAADSWEPVDGQPELWISCDARIPVVFGVAPVNPDTGRRATTGDIFQWLLRVFHLPTSSAILQITTSIYWIANQIALRTSAPRSMMVATTGQRDNLHNGPPQVFRAQHYLQEIKAVLDYLPKLDHWANVTD